MKTEELQGAALDWAVHKIEFARMQAAGEYVKQWVLDDHARGHIVGSFSTDWDWGGPIIEREKVHLTHRPGEVVSGNNWTAFLYQPHRYADGPTPLIAAMRCYVASKLGDDVVIPKELK